MAPTIKATEGAFVPDPEEWPAPDSSGLSPQALDNEADDLAATLPTRTTVPIDADEADVLDQLLDVAPDEEDEPRSA